MGNALNLKGCVDTTDLSFCSYAENSHGPCLFMFSTGAQRRRQPAKSKGRVTKRGDKPKSAKRGKGQPKPISSDEPQPHISSEESEWSSRQDDYVDDY